MKGYNNYPTTVSEAYSQILLYKNDSITYSGKIKDVNAYSFVTDEVVKYKKRKPSYSGEKGGGTGGGENGGGMGGDTDRGSTATMVEPHIYTVQCFC